MIELMPPQRRITDHVHPEVWTVGEQHRFEDRIADELAGLREDVEKLTTRVLVLFGGVILAAFLLSIGAPFLRGLLQLP